jgi:superfamily I DNA and RNA helicase
VLALKAAYLHAQHPDWKIAVTFNTRSLKGQFRQRINTFSIEQTNEEPDWDNVQIIHAWGAPGGGDRHGLMRSAKRMGWNIMILVLPGASLGRAKNSREHVSKRWMHCDNP